MHRLLALLLVTILATVALAAPTAKQASTPSLKKRSFIIPRIRKTGYIRKPSEAMGRAYRKFGWSMTTPDGSPWVAVSKTPTTMNLHADVSSSSNTTSSDQTIATNDRHLSNLKDWIYATFSWGYAPPAASSAVAAPSAEASYAAASSAAVTYITVSSAAASYTVASSTAAAASATPTPANTSPAPAYAAPAPAADGDDETGEVIATPADNGAEYLSPVTIGGQKLNLNFDTGSSDLWVFSTSLTSAQIGEHSAYDPSKSSSYQAIDGATFSLSYGDGSGAAGVVGTDTVDIGGATVTRQAIELATSVSSAFVSDADSDGLVGLAFSTLNSVSPRPQKTFFDNIMSELAQPVFTAALDLDGSGTYEFGTIDSSKFTGDLHFTPVNASSGFWQVDSARYSVGGKDCDRTNASPAIIDTGTSLLLLDPEVVQAYYASVPSAKYDSTVGGYTYDCSENLPEFAVAVGDNYMANIPGSGITFAPVTTKTCFGGIQSNSGSDLQIFGDVLLKHHFVVFNGESEVIGMAAKAE
ncbi:acid protease [Aureobasidium sp. EXF-3400]|nr:acid protease [Aureobasidium sp. EXF-12344]KAI4780615.1 acid protease [Aureobasidium sp. EXF-3400]